MNKEHLDKLKINIKEKNKNLFDLISSVSDEQIEENYFSLMKSIDEEKGTDYKIVFFVENEILKWEYSASSKKAQLFENSYNVRKNFLIGYDSINDYLLNMNEINKEGRVEVLSFLKKLILDIKENKNTKGLWLYGDNQIGKTFIMKSFLNLLASKNKTTTFIFMPDMVQKLKNTIKSTDVNDELDSIINRAKKADFLLIDDITANITSPWIRDTFLLPVIDYRLNNNEITLFTSNYSLSEFEKKLSYLKPNTKDEVSAKRVSSRINSMVEQLELKD